LGSLKVYKADPMMLLWALCASLFVFLFAAVNWLRCSRPEDMALAWICLVAGLAWIVASLRFGQLIGNVADARVLIFLFITLGLCAFSVRGILWVKA
jgi:hypothetical protein